MSTCNRCGQDIAWAKTDATGANMPIDMTAADDGNVVYISGSIVHVLKRGEKDSPEFAGKPRFKSHIASCPKGPSAQKAQETAKPPKVALAEAMARTDPEPEPTQETLL